MIIKNNNKTISFSMFSRFPELLCVMSTRNLGNLTHKPFTSAKPLLNLYNIALDNFVAMEQVHGAGVSETEKADSGKLVSRVDALVTKTKNLYLSVKTADCVPVFFYDPVQKIVGVSHAGWRGTLLQIVKKTLEQMKKLGSKPGNIFAALGPHIAGCCYDVPEERARLFLEEFNDDFIVYKNANKWFLDLGTANKKLLLESGIIESQIDAPISCTSCQVDQFFSNRKEGINAGRMLGIIGMKN
jgi:YfiH family protein